MSPVSAIALSGVTAATRRFEVAASNIANVRSTGATDAARGPAPYTPLEVNQRPNASGGVVATISSSSRAALLQYDPGAPYADARGYVASPAVDMIGEVVDLVSARHAFDANLAVLRSDTKMMKDVLDIAV